jgi:carboxylesterase type B
MVAHGSEALADAFVMESGACVAGSLAPRTRERAERAGIAYADNLCPFTSDMVGCLRGLPADKLVPADFVTAAGGQADLAWPYVDGSLLSEQPMALMRAGKLNHGPAIVGSNAREAALYPVFGFPTANSKLDLLTLLIGLYPTDWPAIYAQYEPADDAGAKEAFIRAQSDEQFRCPSRALARVLAAQGSHAYLYSFEVYPAAHSMELDYVFGWPSGGPSEQFPKEAPIPPTASVVQAVQSYWTTFARGFDPSGGSLPTRPPYRLADDVHMVLAQPLSVGHALARDDCDFWDSVYARSE